MKKISITLEIKNVFNRNGEASAAILQSKTDGTKTLMIWFATYRGLECVKYYTYSGQTLIQGLRIARNMQKAAIRSKFSNS